MHCREIFCTPRCSPRAREFPRSGQLFRMMYGRILASRSKMADLRHLGFYGSVMGSLKSQCTTSYRSSIDTIGLNCLVFEKIAYFGMLATDRQTDRQTDKRTNRWTSSMRKAAVSLSRAAA